MKNSTLLKSVVVLFATFLAITNLSAQNTSSPQWELMKSTTKVDVYKQVASCTSAEVSMEFWNLKFVNKTSAPVTVKYHAQHSYDGNCATCGNDEYKFTVSVPANSSVLAACDGGNEYDNQAVFIKNLNRTNYANFSNFDLGNFVVQ